MSTRKPFVKGKFYKDDAKELRKQIMACFQSEFCIGKKKKIQDMKIKSKRHIRAGIVPHAGYEFSGACSANFYKEMLQHELPNLIFIIGSNHSGFSSALTTDDFETPFGTAKTDVEIVNKLSNELGIDISELVHRNEHSIEVQIPFLQYIYKIRKQKFRIVPLIIAEDIDYADAGRKIREIISEFEENRKESKKSTIIVSTDLTHYGMKYGYSPYFGSVKSVLQKIRNHDLKAISIIKQLDSKKLLSFVNISQPTICGVYPVLVMMEALENVKKASLLKYYTSADINKKYDEIVSYSSIEFE